jgi:cell shape-determining protein MreC
MKGKKADINFVASFIIQCAKANKSTPKEICQEAQNQISLIDEKIKEINNLKLQRSRLQDVLSHFNVLKKDNSKDKQILDFHNVKYKSTAAWILHYLGNLGSQVKRMEASELSKLLTENCNTPQEDINFTIKQLIELQVLKKINKELCADINFTSFGLFICHYAFPETKHNND